jgi:hypothetical protein
MDLMRTILNAPEVNDSDGQVLSSDVVFGARVEEDITEEDVDD